MSATPDDAFALIDKIRYDLTAAQGKITELKRTLAELTEAMPRKPRYGCPACGVSFSREERMLEHVELVHG